MKISNLRYLGCKKQSLFIVVACALFINVNAQTDVVSSGGNATGNEGVVTYSVGQIAVQTSSNSTTTITEGVQQPYEISVVGTDNFQNISLNAVLYPNPTLGDLQLTILNAQLKNAEIRVYDVNGKYLLTKKIEGETTHFNISDYALGTYFVKVLDGKNTLKTFKVVKSKN